MVHSQGNELWGECDATGRHIIVSLFLYAKRGAILQHLQFSSEVLYTSCSVGLFAQSNSLLLCVVSKDDREYQFLLFSVFPYLLEENERGERVPPIIISVPMFPCFWCTGFSYRSLQTSPHSRPDTGYCKNAIQRIRYFSESWSAFRNRFQRNAPHAIQLLFRVP